MFRTRTRYRPSAVLRMSQTKVSSTPACRDQATRVASRPIAAFISLDTGHHAFALDAIDWNVARSMSGIFAVTVRLTEVMEKRSPSFSMTTSDLLSTCSGTKFAISSILTNDMVKHAACAAPSSSSGLVPGTVTSEEAVGIFFQRAALGRDRPLAFTQTAVPSGRPIPNPNFHQRFSRDFVLSAVSGDFLFALQPLAEC